MDKLYKYPCEDCISRAQAIKAMDELENEDIEAYGCSIPEGFDGERARKAICLLPSIQPKPKFILKSDGTIEQIKNYDVLDKIRAEIIEMRSKQNVGVLECLDIIDKYKAESEDKE